MNIKHRLLQRQIRKHLGEETKASAGLSRLLEAVEDAYGQFETDRKLVELSMELSSNELLEANARLRQKYERDEAVLESLRMSVRALRSRGATPPGDGSNDLLDLSNVIREQVNLRAAAEEKIREQAALLDTANDAIYVCGLDGVIQFWNQGAERLYGWTRSEALGRDIAALFPPEPGQASTPEKDTLGQGNWSGDRRLLTKAGASVIVHSRMTLVRDAGGHARSLFSINTDITEKKELEAQFLRGQRMESLGALASGIAHDLNNVLVPVLLGTQLLRSAVESREDIQTLSDMETSARRGADIVKQVLMFARGVEGDRLALEPRHFLREMETIATNTFPKNIRVVTQIAPDLWPVMGDATQLHQALLNLCINARDAMHYGGTLTLTAANADENGGERVPPGLPIWGAAEARPGPHVRMTVIDTGTGISPKTLDKIFEPFFTTKEVGKGTGLGLSTVLGIVRSHGGFVRVRSEIGGGSSFELNFPAVPAATVVSVQNHDLDLLRGHGEWILVVDDEKAVRDVAARILDKFGYKAVTRTNGEEAAEFFARQHATIAAVVSDIAMPGMDGPALVRVLRRIDPGVRIMGMSGHGENAGNTNSPWDIPKFLSKPFTVEKFLATLSELLVLPGGK